jgi:hypothetical protein
MLQGRRLQRLESPELMPEAKKFCSSDSWVAASRLGRLQ